MRKTVVEGNYNVVAHQDSTVKYSWSCSKLLSIWGSVFAFIGKCKKMYLEGIQVTLKKNDQTVHSSPS
jgi:hypothetical protein